MECLIFLSKIRKKSTKNLVDFLNLMSFLFLSTLFLGRRNLTAKKIFKIMKV